MENIMQAKCQSQTVEIHYTSPRAINIGDVFYRVESGENVCFHEPCKVCDGTGKLTVKGVTFKCPCCNTQKQTITIQKHVVRRYRVYKIEQETDTYDWKMRNYRRIKFSLYRKVGHGHYIYGDTGGHFQFYDNEFAEYYNIPFGGDTKRGEMGIYDNYAVAIKIAEQMNAVELQRLADYNKEFGTEHEAVFKVTNDPKSN